MELDRKMLVDTQSDGAVYVALFAVAEPRVGFLRAPFDGGPEPPEAVRVAPLPPEPDIAPRRPAYSDRKSVV